MQYSFSDGNKPLEYDANGFLRNKIRFNKVGPMDYLAADLGVEKPDHLAPDDIVSIMIHPDTLFDPESIRSLEGMPVVAFEHEWATVDGMDFDETDALGQRFKQVGSVAGTPYQNGQYLEGEVVITNKAVQEAIRNGTLADVSSGYNALYEMENGQYDGCNYDGCQRQIRYNHVCLLRPNQGRAGKDVRILNSKQEADKMPENVKVTIPGTDKVISVAEGDVNTVNTEFTRIQNAKPESIQVNNEMMSAADIEETMNKLTTLNEQITSLTAERDEAAGKIAALQEQLAQATNPQKLEEAANEMIEEREEAVEMVSQNAGKAMNKDDIDELRASLKGKVGHDLRLEAVNQVRTMNSKPALTEDQAKNEDFVRGQFDVYKETPVQNNKSVPAAQAVMNQGGAGGQGGDMTAAQKLGFKSEGGK